VRIIGVIDLLDGAAVHAVRGLRQQYEPVHSVGGDALALARGYAGMGVHELYAADLDAIRGHGANDALASAIAARCEALWLDAGISSVGRARHAIALGAARVIVGLETLSSYSALALICADIGDDRVAFSLDLRLIARVREAAPHVTLVAGGGVRGPADLTRLAAAGCDAALVATALQSGALRADHDSATR
jgi:phosphoribosylformimino-5-aminoimidazole carboxamide ribotide isomerase